MREKDVTQRNNQFTIKGTPYDIDEVYFEQIMKQLGHYLCEQYKHKDVVTPLEVMSQVAYIQDLTVQQKMYAAYFIGQHSENLDYEGYILSCINKHDD